MQVSDVREWPTLRCVIGDIIDGDERRARARAEFGEKPEPAWLVAAMIMDTGKESAARCCVGQG